MSNAFTSPSPALARISLLGGMAGNAAAAAFFLAALPLLGRSLGFSDIQSGLLVGLGSLGLLVAAPLWGHWSERVGRRPILLAGFAGAALTPALMAMATTGRMEGWLTPMVAFAALLGLRLVYTLLTGGLMPVAQAVMADTSSEAHRPRAMGLLGASFGIGSILGAGVLWRMAGDAVTGFWVLAGLCSVMFLLAVFLLPETRPASPAASPDNAPSSTPLKVLLPFIAITLVGVASFAALKQVTGLRLQDTFGLDTQEALARTGFVMTVSAAAMIVAQVIGLRTIRLAPWALIMLSCIISAAALLTIAVTTNYQIFVTALALVGAAQGLLLPANLGLLSLAAGAGAQGRFAGLNAIGQGLGMILGPVLGAILHELSPAAPFIGLAAAFGGLLVLALWHRRNHAPEPGPQQLPAFNDSAAQTYDQRIVDLIPGYHTLHETTLCVLRSELDGRSGQAPPSVLVVGAGTGNELLVLARANPEWRFVAIDPSEDMLAIARQKIEAAGVGDGVSFQVADMSSYQPEQLHDAAVCLLVSHFIPDDGSRAQLLKDLSASLKSGAPLVIADFIDSDLSPALAAYRNWLSCLGKDEQHIGSTITRVSNFHRISETRLQEHMADAGFRPAATCFQALDVRGYVARRE